ncbi:hypothetical protein CHS0354_028679 [Potamilus streckersoni]|uniref:Endonuclease/exonuclease/phosphatase domain-containing protein n=1 Tax=Potamilus streckersoni TaxID=2493646 RepID=A0AAE0SWR2_9BIVA|nr:hypothetical protein CHS0354_028679 [Potamilus streckersoni]
MPNMSSETKNNNKGAVPKTTLTTEKFTTVTEAKQKLIPPVKTGLKILIMNASGPNQGEGTATRRKQAIQSVITRHNPDLVLFQEFSWRGIHGKTWSADPVPEHFQLTLNNDASILYNINELTVEEKPIRELQRILQELQRPTSKHSTPIPLDFAPIPRMSLRMVKTKGVPVMEFICISWHGKHAGMSSDTKVTEFTYLMIFLNEIYLKCHLPILIAGDFNVEVKLICLEVKDPFKLHEYKASERRKKKGVIDYFIATTELYLSDIEPVDLKKDSKADKPEEVLDHDPIIALLQPAPLSDTVPACNKATSRMPQKTK